MGLSLAEVFTEHLESYLIAHRSHLTGAHYRALRAILNCRTSVMGGRFFRCDSCSQQHFVYHSCNHRSCPQCGNRAQHLWSAKQEAKLLPGVPYYMITFTVPAELRSALMANPREGYRALMTASAQALKDVIATKHSRTLPCGALGGATTGFISVLHTWGRQLQYHPHVHLIVPAVAYDPVAQEVILPKNPESFLIHFKPLAARFRTLMREALQQIEGLTLSTEACVALSPATQWNVQVKPVGQGQTALRYLARYVCKSALNPSRLLGYDAQGNVRLKWTCSTSGKTQVMTLTPHELIRRVLLHVLPKGFARVRHYGYLSPAAKKTRLFLRALLGELGEPPVIIEPLPAPCCSHCGNGLTLVRILQAPRPPPNWKR